MTLSASQAAGFMARALQLAERGRYSTHPNPRVGCVIVKDGQRIGEGAHLRAGEPHAEVHALREAGAAARGAEVFVTLEPCSHFGRTPPCADALIAAGVAKVHVAAIDANPKVAGSGVQRLREAGIVVETGLLQAQAEALNRGFFSRMRRGRPWLTLKLAASLDGRTAMASGESQWITGAEARADVHRLRAEAGAVLTASGTVLADDPQLSVRDFLPAWSDLGDGIGSGADVNSVSQSEVPALRQPDRIVLDGQARVPATARVWAEGARRFWLTLGPQSAPAGVENLVVAADAQGQLSLPAALNALAQQGVNEVLVECGPRLAGSLLQAQLVDELVVYLAPRLLGDAARPLAVLPGLTRLAQAPALQLRDARSIGCDLRLSYVPLSVSET